MGLANIIRSGIATASKVTKDLQPEVQLYSWKSQTGDGTPIYASKRVFPVLVEKKQRLVRGSEGQNVLSSTTVTFLEVVPALGGSGRSEPIDIRDKIVLPDGSIGTIVATGGLVDKGTNLPFYNEVYLG